MTEKHTEEDLSFEALMSSLYADMDMAEVLPDVEPKELPVDDMDSLEVNQPYLYEGVTLLVEYLKDQERVKEKDSGKVITTVMPAPYGYVADTEVRDGDNLDFYLNAEAFDKEAHPIIIDQIHPAKDDEPAYYDEPKLMIGFSSVEDATNTYTSAFGDGSGLSRIGDIVVLPWDSFMAWRESGNKDEPVSHSDVVTQGTCEIITSNEYSVAPDSSPETDDGESHDTYPNTADGPQLTNATEADNDAVSDEPAPTTTVNTPDTKVTVSDKKPSPPKPVIRNGAEVITIPVVNHIFHLVTETSPDGSNRYTIHINGYVSGSDWGVPFEDTLRLLATAKEEDQFTFMINTYGGEVNTAARLMSAMRNSDAHVTTVAAGPVASAGVAIWAVGQTRVILPGSYFMEHMSSHGDGGNSIKIARTAEAIIEYTKSVMFGPIIESGIFTEDQLKEMIEDGTDVYITSAEAQDRLNFLGAEEESE